MSLEAATFSILAASAAVDAIAGDRISPHQRLQSTTLPAVTYRVEQIEPVRELAGTAGLYRGNLTVSAIAETYAAAKDLGNAVRNAVSAATGSHGGITIRAARHSLEVSVEAGIGEGEEDLPYQIDHQFIVHYTE